MEKAKRVSILLILSAIIYLGMGLYADLRNLITVIQGVKPYLYLQLILLTTTAYIIRLVKWTYLLRVADVRLNARENVFVFLSGLAMTVTPAKIGEVWKGFLIKELKDVRLSRTIPVVVVDRLTDVISLIVLSLLGITYYERGIAIITLIILGVIAFIVAFKTGMFFKTFDLVIEKKFKKYTESATEFSIYLSKLLNANKALLASLLGVLAWFFECLTIHLTVLEFNAMTLPISVFIFSFASLVGSLSMIPGGIGVTEASISGLLQYFGIDTVSAVATSIIVRLTTLWYGTLIGTTTYLLFKRYIMK